MSICLPFLSIPLLCKLYKNITTAMKSEEKISVFSVFQRDIVVSNKNTQITTKFEYVVRVRQKIFILKMVTL